MSLEDFRATAQAVADRAKNDSQYQAALLNDPVGVLTAAGVSPEVASQLVGTEAESDVQGYSMPTDGCNDTTCWTSGCPGTCNVSWCQTTFSA